MLREVQYGRGLSFGLLYWGTRDRRGTRLSYSNPFDRKVFSGRMYFDQSLRATTLEGFDEETFFWLISSLLYYLHFIFSV